MSADHTSIKNIIEYQKTTLRFLEQVSERVYLSPKFEKFLKVLESVVKNTHSTATATIESADADPSLKEYAKILLSQSQHLESYIESFRIAQDADCINLLAQTASRVLN